MPSFYEFFAGGGMAREGLGPRWTCLFANDIDEKKAASYRENWGAGVLRTVDVGLLTPDDLPGPADLSWASFPCQDLSLAGDYAGLSFRQIAQLHDCLYRGCLLLNFPPQHTHKICPVLCCKNNVLLGDLPQVIRLPAEPFHVMIFQPVVMQVSQHQQALLLCRDCLGGKNEEKQERKNNFHTRIVYGWDVRRISCLLPCGSIL